MTQRQPTTKSEHKCRSKTAYASERIAQVRADQLAEKRGVMLYVYRCRDCNRWHHTRQAQKGARKKPLVLVQRDPLRDVVRPIDDFEVLDA